MLVYSTTTAAAPFVAEQVADLFAPLPEAEDYYTPWCGLCGRATDHFAEHDDAVLWGLATYDAHTGDVRRTATYDHDIFLLLCERVEVDVEMWMRDLQGGE